MDCGGERARHRDRGHAHDRGGDEPGRRMRLPVSARMAGRSARLAVAMARGRPQPYSMVFVLTNRCNFRCDYCDVPANAGAEMSTVEFRAAIAELAEAGMGRAAFGGGEALLRPDAVELIEYAKAQGCFTSLNSNGWTTERWLDRLAGCLIH